MSSGSILRYVRHVVISKFFEKNYMYFVIWGDGLYSSLYKNVFESYGESGLILQIQTYVCQEATPGKENDINSENWKHRNRRLSNSLKEEEIQ